MDEKKPEQLSELLPYLAITNGRRIAGEIERLIQERDELLAACQAALDENRKITDQLEAAIVKATGEQDRGKP